MAQATLCSQARSAENSCFGARQSQEDEQKLQFESLLAETTSRRVTRAWEDGARTSRALEKRAQSSRTGYSKDQTSYTKKNYIYIADFPTHLRRVEVTF